MIALDCTFRDGGYYNDWDFDIELANYYLKVMERSKIDAVEIGFRSPSKSNFANVSDAFISINLHVPTTKYFGVMINNNEINSKEIKKLFYYANVSLINLVRNCVHFKDIDQAKNTCQELKFRGYTVCCNLMQAATKSYDEIRRAAAKVRSWNAVDVLYLADSLGDMNHDSVHLAFKAIKEEWSGLTGFHAHNNKGQALNNSLEAVDIGVDWIDSTIMGMGRGPGNCETEYLLNELNKRGFGEYSLKELYKLSFEFMPLKELYKWGPYLFYYLAAEYNIHPTYIQKMLQVEIPEKIILNAIFHLKNKKANSFDKNLLKGVLYEKFCNHNSNKNG